MSASILGQKACDVLGMRYSIARYMKASIYLDSLQHTPLTICRTRSRFTCTMRVTVSQGASRVSLLDDSSTVSGERASIVIRCPADMSHARHTNIVVYGRELGYGYGIIFQQPGQVYVRSVLRIPLPLADGLLHQEQELIEVINVGETLVDEEAFTEFLVQLADRFTVDNVSTSARRKRSLC